MAPHDILSKAGDVLRRLRFNDPAKKSQRAVAEDLGIHYSNFNGYEAGKRNIHLSDIFKFAEYYNLKPSELVAMIQETPADLIKVESLQREIELLYIQNDNLKAELEAARKELLNG